MGYFNPASLFTVKILLDILGVNSHSEPTTTLKRVDQHTGSHSEGGKYIYTALTAFSNPFSLYFLIPLHYFHGSKRGF